MRKTLIIYAHPQTPGHAPFTLEEVKKSLPKDSYEVLDLYAMQFQPVLQKEEHYTAGNKTPGKDIPLLQKKIKDAKQLIFIYPVWWGSMPAILKGFFDRVLLSGYAYHFKPLPLINTGMPIGHMKGKKAAVFITGGTPNFLYHTYMMCLPTTNIKRLILQFCGIKARVYYTGRATLLSDTNKAKIKKRVKKALRWLD